MPSLEAVCGRLFGHSGWIPKVLWGGALVLYPDSSTSVSLGYLLEYTIRLRQSRQWELPEWRDMEIPSLFSNGGIKHVAIHADLAMGESLFLVGWLASELVDFLSLRTPRNQSVIFPLALSPLSSAHSSFFHPVNNYLARAACFPIVGTFERHLCFQLGQLWPELILPVIAFWGVIPPGPSLVRTCLSSSEVLGACSPIQAPCDFGEVTATQSSLR